MFCRSLCRFAPIPIWVVHDSRESISRCSLSNSHSKPCLYINTRIPLRILPRQLPSPHIQRLIREQYRYRLKEFFSFYLLADDLFHKTLIANSLDQLPYLALAQFLQNLLELPHFPRLVLRHLAHNEPAITSGYFLAANKALHNQYHLLSLCCFVLFSLINF